MRRPTGMAAWLCRRPGALFAQAATVAAASLLVASVSLATMTGVRESASKARSHSREAVLSAEIVRAADRLASTLMDQRSGAAQVPAPQHLTAEEALAASEILNDAVNDATELHGLARRRDTLELWGAVHDAQDALRRAAAGRDPASGMTRLERSVQSFSEVASRLAPEFRAKAEADNRFNEDLAGAAMLGIIAAVAAAAVAVSATTWLVSRRMRDAILKAGRETSALLQTTQTMERRNGQFRALYQIVTEISETLSMKYVVETTIREARKLVRADVTVLRLLQGDWLEVAGSSVDVEADAAGLGPIQLGTGVCGQAAKRGRSVLIHVDAEAGMAPGELVLGMQSGVVVPLIVGARVVGTMSCWSRQPHLFTEDDQQVLEMMGSQVATAVAAADSHRATEQLAHTDTLTQLANRRQLSKDISERFQPALTGGRALAVAMIDIDHFKRFNDEFGHKTGDITLQKVASVLRAALREEDFVYRYGGEEFTVVVEDATREEALKRLERVRVTVERTPLTGDSGQPVGPVTVSVGVATCPDGPSEFDDLLQLADKALYQAKWAGRNRVTAYSIEFEAIPAAA